FLRGVLGLTSTDGVAFADDRGASVFSIELARTREPVRPRAANDLGVYRLALSPIDLDRDYATPVAAGVQPFSPPAPLDIGPGAPVTRPRWPRLRAHRAAHPGVKPLRLRARVRGDRIRDAQDHRDQVTRPEEDGTARRGQPSRPGLAAGWWEVVGGGLAETASV